MCYRVFLIIYQVMYEKYCRLLRGRMDVYLIKSLFLFLINFMFLLVSLNKVSKDLLKRCLNLIKDFLNW